MKKKKKIIVFGVSLFLVTLGVSAATILYSANNVTYKSSTLSGNNVQNALENLYNKYQSSTTTPPSGMTCTKKTNIKCRRATTLHTETCNNSYCEDAGYESGDIITYGNQTVTEGVLSAGDAFDCDVNGDGTFDASTERFYYVSNYYDTNTQSFNDNYAVLIYYSNVKEGVVNDKGKGVYDNSWVSYNGPRTAREQLPKNNQWSNIRLYKEERQILAENNATTVKNPRSGSTFTLPTSFSYAGYSARFLTYQEFFNACYYDKRPVFYQELYDKCQFLFERNYFSDNGGAAWMFENPYSSGIDQVFTLGTYYINPGEIDDLGIRPAIEVLKSEMSY